MSTRFDRMSDRTIYAILAVLSVLSRLPFLRTFELVAYDGTYYLNQAKTLFSGHMAGAFPIGYPLVVRLFQIVLRDYQLAGQAVSFVASVASACLAYRLAKHFTNRGFAFLAAVVLALNPLFIRLSLMTLSESLYVFWVLLSLMCFVERRWLPFGLAMGMAAITRPEALAIAVLLALSRIRRPKEMAVIAISFLVVYCANAAVLSVTQHSFVLLPKSGFVGSSLENWRAREVSIDFEGKEAVQEELEAAAGSKSLAADYLRRLPEEILLLGRHVLPAIFLLALLALRHRKYTFLAVALVPFFAIPLATVRSMDRYVLPYVPILILLAVLAAAELRGRSLRALAVYLIAASAVILPFVNSAVLWQPEEPELLGVKRAAIAFRDKVKPGDRIADRKPFFAFYAGGEYVEIPIAPYEDVMKLLTSENVKYLALHNGTIRALRPALRPLLYSRSVVNGEMRLRQVYFDHDGEVVFQRVRDQDPAEWTQITPPGGADIFPAWSPKGDRIAFRSQRSDGQGGIYVIELGARLPRKLTAAPFVYDQLAWSPDGRRIAFASDHAGQVHLYAVDTETGGTQALTSGANSDSSPAWSPSGDEIVFAGTRGGETDIWSLDLRTSTFKRLTEDGGNSHPAISPNGDRVAWIKEDAGVWILDRSSGETLQLLAPRSVRYTPAWSGDGRYLAVTARDWGSWDIYIMKADGTNALLLTKNHKQDTMPAWSPDGGRIALVSNTGQQTFSIWIIEGLEPYKERLETRYDFDVFPAPSG
jgi:Tol biopolymer transport system component